MAYIGQATLDRELKKGSAELLILSLVENRARHGYEIGKLIEQRSAGDLHFHVASLYPLLYRLEKRGWLSAEWGDSENGREAKFYKLSAKGRRQLATEEATWNRLSQAVALILDAARQEA